LLHCDISMYICIITWICSSPCFSPFCCSPLPTGTWTSLKFYIHSCIQSTSTILTNLPSFTLSLSLSLVCDLSMQDLFFILSLTFLNLIYIYHLGPSSNYPKNTNILTFKKRTFSLIKQKYYILNKF
jgi:hypothetical protein